MAVEIVFETHSVTTDNEAGIATGWKEGQLSERGKSLATKLGQRRRTGIDAVFSSDLRRAVQTVEIAFSGTGIPVHLDARLRECNYGDWNGMPVEKLNAERSGHVSEPFPGGESFQDAIERMADFLTELAREWGGHRVLIVGHSATRWALDHLLKGEPLAYLVDAPYDWREGWAYSLPDGWTPQVPDFDPGNAAGPKATREARRARWAGSWLR